MSLDRTAFNALVDNVTVWNKDKIKTVILDPVDVAIAAAGGFIFGNWTPVLGGDAATSGQSYSSQVGSYCKMGPLVIALCGLGLTNKGTISGAAVIKGLPFPAKAGPGGQTGPAIIFDAFAGNWITMSLYINPGTTVGFFQGIKAAGPSNAAFVPSTDIGNTSSIGFTWIYLTD